MSFLLISIIIIIFCVGTIASTYFLYVLLKPYFQSATGRRRVLKWSIILFASSFAMAVVVLYLMRGPDYFEAGINQLHHSKYIKDHIGDFSSYTYDNNQFSKDPRSPTIFQIQINGDSTTQFLSCTMSKVNGNWKLIKIEADSTVKGSEP
jgi:hypothetical protein